MHLRSEENKKQITVSLSIMETRMQACKLHESKEIRRQESMHTNIRMRDTKKARSKISRMLPLRTQEDKKGKCELACVGYLYNCLVIDINYMRTHRYTCIVCTVQVHIFICIQLYMYRMSCIHPHHVGTMITVITGRGSYIAL